MNTTTDMIRQIALAIKTQDMSILEECSKANYNWIQSKDEMEAMESLIDAAIDAVEELSA